jgi:hypothetical protein
MSKLSRFLTLPTPPHPSSATDVVVAVGDYSLHGLVVVRPTSGALHGMSTLEPTSTPGATYVVAATGPVKCMAHLAPRSQSSPEEAHPSNCSVQIWQPRAQIHAASMSLRLGIDLPYLPPGLLPQTRRLHPAAMDP